MGESGGDIGSTTARTLEGRLRSPPTCVVLNSRSARPRPIIEPIHRIISDYERKYWFLWKENKDLREEILQMQNQVAEHGINPVKESGGIRSWLKRIFQ